MDTNLWDQNESNESEKGSHDERNPSSPAPTKVAHGDKTTDDRSTDGSNKSGTGEDSNCDSSVDGIEDISKKAANYTQWSTEAGQSEQTNKQIGHCEPCKETTEKSAHENSLEILCHSNRNLKDGKDKEANEQRQLSSIKLRKWTPNDRT